MPVIDPKINKHWHFQRFSAKARLGVDAESVPRVNGECLIFKLNVKDAATDKFKLSHRFVDKTI